MYCGDYLGGPLRESKKSSASTLAKWGLAYVLFRLADCFYYYYYYCFNCYWLEGEDIECYLEFTGVGFGEGGCYN